MFARFRERRLNHSKALDVATARVFPDVFLLKTLRFSTDKPCGVP